MPTHKFTSEQAREAGKKGKRKGLETRLQEFLSQPIKEGETKTREELLYEAAYRLALKGSVQAIIWIFERAYGKPMQKIEADIRTNVIEVKPDSDYNSMLEIYREATKETNAA